MKKLIVCTLLVMAMATQAYGWGSRGGNAPSQVAIYGAGGSDCLPNGSNGGPGETPNGPGNHVSVPEPSTLLLLGAGLGMILGFRKKLKKG